jgi:hypothetical protein
MGRRRRVASDCTESRSPEAVVGSETGIGGPDGGAGAGLYGDAEAGVACGRDGLMAFQMLMFGNVRSSIDAFDSSGSGTSAGDRAE